MDDVPAGGALRADIGPSIGVRWNIIRQNGLEHREVLAHILETGLHGIFILSVAAQALPSQPECNTRMIVNERESFF